MLTKSNLCLWFWLGYHFTSNLSRCVTCFRNCELQRPATSPHSPGGFPRCCEHGRGIPLPMSISNKKLYKHSFCCYSKALCFSFPLTAFVTIHRHISWTANLFCSCGQYCHNTWKITAHASGLPLRSAPLLSCTAGAEQAQHERGGVINPMATASSRLLTGMWFSVIFLWLCASNVSAFFLIYLVLLIVT